MVTKVFSLALPVILALGACSSSSNRTVVHLVDEFDAATVEGRAENGPSDGDPVWDFATGGDRPLLGWKAGPGVADLRLEEGRLAGRTTSEMPLLYADTEGMPQGQSLYAIKLRLATSRDGETAVRLAAEDTDIADFAETMKEAPWLVTRRVGSSDEPQDVTLLWTSGTAGPGTLIVRPADAPGVDFEIASIDLVSQRKHRASTPTGVEWQGLDGIFRESIASRTPESFTVDFSAPQDSWLDLHVGTVDDQPVTFVVEDLSQDTPQALLTRTITTPNRWEPTPIELPPGERNLRFRLRGEQDLLAGFWGGPTVRVRGAKPKTVRTPAEALGGAEAPLGVIVVLSDTLRSDHLSVYGYSRKTDPNLRRMAEEGVTFLDNVSQATWTKVSTPAILTSLYPTSHRVHQQSQRLSAAAQTLAEIYREAGYATVSYATNGFAGRVTNLHQGFEELHEAQSFDDATGSKTAREATDRALDWLERHAESPFFLYLHVTDPHSPFEPYPPYDVVWADPALKDEHEKQRDASRAFIDWAPDRGLPDRHEIEQAGVDPEGWVAYEKDWYDGSIRGGDSELGRILERLQSLGIKDRVAVVFISDHGEEFFEHGRMWHGQHAYGELANVPLVISCPSVLPAGLRVRETVRSIDLLPTLLDLSGLETPPEAHGQSLVPLIAAAHRLGAEEGTGLVNAAQELGWLPMAAVTEKARTIGEGPEPREKESYGLVKDGWKLVHNVRGDDSVDEFELFDHRNDPLNLENVAMANGEVVEALKHELEVWRNMVEQSKLPRGDVSEDMTPDEADRLRSLGYIQ